MFTLKDMWFWVILIVANISMIVAECWILSMPSYIAFFCGVFSILIQITITVLILRRYVAYKLRQFNRTEECKTTEKEK